MDDKTKSIVAHIWIVGWIIALIQNQKDKGELTSFYLRQTLGIYIIGLLAWLPLPVLPLLILVLCLIMWIFSLVGSLNAEKKLIPSLGEMFQQWFKSIS